MLRESRATLLPMNTTSFLTGSINLQIPVKIYIRSIAYMRIEIHLHASTSNAFRLSAVEQRVGRFLI